MNGFCFSGDLFTLFVFFELMSVVAFSLTAYKIEAASIEGGLNFAITNSIGAYLTLWGIALIYGRTGALNLAQLQRVLAAAPADQLVMMSFFLIASGFLIKAAVVPFHFWLADAHAVAPTPVCVLFSGVMVELGVFGVFRVYWTVFEPALRPFAGNIRTIFLVVGTVTAVVGAIMCFTQRHFKRLLAFSTISHIGMIMVGCSTLSARGLAGASLYVLGHGFVKGALFMTAGIFLQRFNSIDELELIGRGREVKWIGLIGLVAGLGLAGFPPFGTYFGKELMEEGATRLGQEWVTWLFTFASALTGAAVLRVMGRVFLGWGCAPLDDSSPTVAEKKETETASDHLPVVMVTMAAVLAVVPVVSGLVPGLGGACQAAAERFVASAGYAQVVLDAHSAGPIAPAEAADPTWRGVIVGTLAAFFAVAIALISLFRDRLPRPLQDGAGLLVRPILRPLHALHSGDIRDYVAWIAVGAAALGGAFVFALR
jgi:multicomponent Na+:H+ antiporter subunit D